MGSQRRWLTLHFSEADRRFDVERTIAVFRVFAVVLYAVAVAFVGPGDDEVATYVIGVGTGLFAIAMLLLVRRGVAIPMAGEVLVCALDAAVYFAVLANNRNDPVDGVYLVGILVIIEGALRWAFTGATVAGLVISTAVLVWTHDVAGDAASELATFRVGAMFPIALVVGALVSTTRAQVEALALAFGASREPMAAVNLSGVVLSANEAMAEIVGTPLDELVGHRLGVLPQKLEPRRGSLEHRVAHVRPDGVHLDLDVTTTVLVARQLAYVVARDVTAAASHERLLASAAYTDSVTGLANRHRLERHLDELLADPERPVALLFTDLDRFKLVNDGFGHPAGDEVLATIGVRLQHAFREQDLVARYGGDEFCVVLPVDEDDVVDRAARRMREHVAEPIELAGTEVTVGCSIGIAVRTTGESATSLLRRADSAMYRAKEAGRGGPLTADSSPS